MWALLVRRYCWKCLKNAPFLAIFSEFFRISGRHGLPTLSNPGYVVYNIYGVFYCSTIAGMDWLSVNEVNTVLILRHTLATCVRVPRVCILVLTSYIYVITTHLQGIGMEHLWESRGSMEVHATLRHKGDSFISNHTSIWSIVHFKFKCTSYTTNFIILL